LRSFTPERPAAGAFDPPLETPFGWAMPGGVSAWLIGHFTCSWDPRGDLDAKAYWIAAYRSVKVPEALAAYAKLAVPAMWNAGGRNLIRDCRPRLSMETPWNCRRGDDAPSHKDALQAAIDAFGAAAVVHLFELISLRV
jgi:hypothetical protein